VLVPVQCDVKNRKILGITVGGREVAFRGIKFLGGPRQLTYVELSFVVEPRSYVSWN
jgi:hypothetical protein